MYELNTSWVLWYHSIKDTTWTKSSYKQMYTFNNLYDYSIFEDVIQLNHLQNGMFFLMRGEIFPTWEDPKNRMGGCVSFKYDNNILKEFLRIILLCITGNLSTDGNLNEINGVSISPKKEFNITKIWLKDDSKDYKHIVKEYDPLIKLEKSIYKKHELSY